MQRIKVDLPQPDGPMRPVIRPGARSRSRPSNTCTLPRFTRSPAIEIAGDEFIMYGITLPSES